MYRGNSLIDHACYITVKLGQRSCCSGVHYCETGVKKGATLAYGGKQVDRPGMKVQGSKKMLLWCMEGNRLIDQVYYITVKLGSKKVLPWCTGETV